MTQENRKTIVSLLSHVEELLDIQEKASKAKRNGDAGIVRAKSTEYAKVKEKIQAQLPVCRAILSADQTSLFA
jgi:hypothetical protein